MADGMTNLANLDFAVEACVDMLHATMGFFPAADLLLALNHLFARSFQSILEFRLSLIQC